MNANLAVINIPALTCPFCGKDITHISQQTIEYVALTCDTCGASGPLAINSNTAKGHWNCRVKPELVIAWEIPPHTKLNFASIASVKVTCTAGNATATAEVARQQFPISADYQKYIENALKMTCVQIYFGLK